MWWGISHIISFGGWNDVGYSTSICQRKAAVTKATECYEWSQNWLKLARFLPKNGVAKHTKKENEKRKWNVARMLIML